MLWVKSDQADSLAIACAWLAAALPWNVTYTADIAGGSLLYVRFPFIQLQFLYGFRIPGVESPVIRDPLSAMAYQSGRPLELVYQVWTVGAAVIALALLLSVSIHLVRVPSTEQRVDPVRLMGVLLLVAAVVLSVANFLLLSRGFGGVPIPLGVIFLYAFGSMLVFVERVDVDTTETDGSDGSRSHT